MAVSIKSEREIALMREAGRVLAIVHEELKKAVKPGITTKDLDRLCETVIRDHGCKPSFLHLYDFPASVCISVNDEVIHGIPSKKTVLHEGDIVSLDAGVEYKGYHSDAARTWGVGEISKEAKQLIDVTRESFFEGIKFAKEGNHLYDISRAIQAHAEKFGYGVVRDFVGHGIGQQVHEDPEVPNFAQRRRGMKLMPGMTLAIEPMINQGTYEVEWMDDEWTIVTADGSLSAHYENTVLITHGEPEVLSVL